MRWSEFRALPQNHLILPQTRWFYHYINTQGSFTLFYLVLRKKNTSCCRGSFTLFEVIWGHEHLLKSTLYEVILPLHTRYSLTLFYLVLRKNSNAISSPGDEVELPCTRWVWGCNFLGDMRCFWARSTTLFYVKWPWFYLVRDIK